MPRSLFGYEVVSRLGEGALSTIYVVSDPSSKQLYALKHVVPKEEKHQRFIQQLETEWAIGKLFRHPGLRKCIDYKTRKKFFGPVTEAGLVMELVDGVTLEQARPDTLPGILDLFLQAGAALGALHHLRQVHCDLKPANIMITPGGSIKIIDFGQACPTGTTKQRVQGTPDFIAPEQVKCQAVDYYTDVYGFGATLYWALTLRKVPTLYTIAKGEKDLIKEQKYPKPHELEPLVPTELGMLVMECLKYNPLFRPESIAAVLKRLTPFAG